MAFASGSVSFRRYFVSGKAPKDITEPFIEALNSKSFGRLGVASDNTQVGWITTRHLFDTELHAGRIAVGRFAHLAMRMDRYAPPAAIVKSYVRLEEQAMLEAKGRQFLSPGERKQARETGRMRAEQEARGGAFRRISSFPVLIDLESRVVCFGNTNVLAGDKFLELFEDTFNCSLDPATPERVAFRALQPAGRERSLENLAAFHLVDAPSDGEDGSGYAERDLSFLGREFLTWLWYRTDQAERGLRLRAGDDVSVMIDKSMRLVCDFRQSGSAVLAGEGVASFPEARAALTTGKQPTRVGMIVGGSVGEFTFVLDGPSLAVSGLIMPEDKDQESDPLARLERRFERIIDMTQLLDGLFELFLEQRLSREWPALSRHLSQWATGRASAGRPPVAAHA